jgi:hypothetical protein
MERGDSREMLWHSPKIVARLRSFPLSIAMERGQGVRLIPLMRFVMACGVLLALCCAAPIDAAGKQPQEYHILASTTGDFPQIALLDYWNGAFVGFAGTYTDAFDIARDAAGRGGWETSGIAPETPAPVADGPVWVVLLIHTAPPGGDPPPIAGLMDD